MQCLLAMVLLGEAGAFAQQLSFRHYGVPDGLARSRVNTIYQDAKGYIWFGTPEGLSRFDGYGFTNYGTHDGLVNPTINGIAEDRRDRLWVATNGGVARLMNNPLEMSQPSSEKFVSYSVGDSVRSNEVNNLIFDREGNLWCATDSGLFRSTLNQDGDPGPRELVAPGKSVLWNSPALADRKGRLWFGISNELIEIVEGHIIKYGVGDGISEIEAVVEDRLGRLLSANFVGLFEFVEPSDPMSAGQWKRLPLDLIPQQAIHSMVAAASGALWLGTTQGLAEYKDGKQTLYTTANGLSDHHILSLAKDREDNLWIGTVNGGVCRLSGKMIVSFDSSAGLPDLRIVNVIESQQGRIYASSDGRLVEIAEGRAILPPGSMAHGFESSGPFAQDRKGYWWINTFRGLCRLRGPEIDLRHTKRVVPAADVAKWVITDVYKDRAGRVWVSGWDDHLYWVDPGKAGRLLFHKISIAPFHYAHPMVADRSGVMWVAWGNEIGRLVNGRLSILQPTEALPATRVLGLFQDSRGWLWVGFRDRGASMTTDPTADPPEFVNYSTRNGLASDTVSSITEDDFGRIYLGTGRGLDQLDVVTGHIRHFTSADGLAGDKINNCMKDSRGFIWVAASGGVSKLDPRAVRANLPPPVYFTRVQIAGENLPVPETGALRLPALAGC